MKTLIELCEGKMWRAVEAMIEGLETQSKRGDFEIDMGRYGASAGDICFGCAATCTVQQITGKNLDTHCINDTYDRASALDMNEYDLRMFECVINDLRCGTIHSLVIYFDKAAEVQPIIRELIYTVSLLNPLHSDTWQQNLEPYRDLAKLLKQNDI
jgi:hypothetical protein